MSDEKPKITNPQFDSRLKSFLRQAAAIIATEKGMNAESRVKLQTLADRTKLPPALFEEAIKRLQTSFDAASNLTHYEKAFLKYLDSEFEKLTGGVLSPGMEKHAIEFAELKFQIGSTRAEQLIQMQAEATGIGRISHHDAALFADQSIADRVGDLTELDQESTQQLYLVGKKWGLSEARVDQIVKERFLANRSKKKPTWKKLMTVSVVGILMIGTGIGVGLAGGWIPRTWIPSPIDNESIAQRQTVKIETPATADSRFPQQMVDRLRSLQIIDLKVAHSVDGILGEDPTQRRLGYHHLVTLVCVDGYHDQRAIADVVCELFYADPDEDSADEVVSTLQQLLARSRSDEFSMRDLKNSYQANHLLGQLYFTRHLPDRKSRQVQVANCIRSALHLSPDENLTLGDYFRESETAIASDQWTQLIQLAWASPGHASVLVQPLLTLTQSKLDSDTLNRYRDDALISIMQTDRLRWQEMEQPIRDSVTNCDEAKLIDWIFIFATSKQDGASGDDRLRDMLSRLLLPRIGVQPASRLREDIDEAIINYGLAYRNRALRPVINRNEILKKFVANTLEIESGGVASAVSPDRIAQLALAVNIELAFCAAIENATHLDDSSFAEFDRLISIPAPRLRELISLPIDRRDSTTNGTATATASDKRRLTASLERLSDLSPDSSGLRILALNQLERVAHRFEGISYRDAEVLASYFLTKLDVKEQVNVNKRIGSFSHWPNLSLAIADQIPDSDVTTDQALTLARLLLDRNFETGFVSEWKKALQSEMIAAISNQIGNQVDLDPNNIKSDWVRLRIYLNDCYRERLAIEIDQGYVPESFVEPYHLTTRLIETIASRPSRTPRKLDVEAAIDLIRKIPSNEIEKTAFANQLLARVLIDDLTDSDHFSQSQSLILELENAFRKHSRAGEQLRATELALLQIVDLKRDSLVNDLLQRARRR